jgi:hypothetical protein
MDTIVETPESVVAVVPELPIKKKRGRKPKNQLLLENSNGAITEAIKKPVTGGDEKPKSRRGRKTKAVLNTYINDKDTINTSDDENIIVKLAVSSSNNEDINNVNNITPGAYDAVNSFESTPFLLNKENDKKEETNENSKVEYIQKTDTLRVVELLKDFEMKNKSAEWPQNTSIACYWCCHKFTTVPFGIPVKYQNDVFYVFGCFCSLECAAAYNFNSKERADEMWERYNLINLVSRKLKYKPNIKQAPPREALVHFGGKMEIDEYRKYFDSTKLLSINFPPMMTITQQVEEINECDVNSEYRYIPIDQDRLNKYKEKLTLKRNKPLTNFKHTLDHLMNLKISE